MSENLRPTHQKPDIVLLTRLAEAGLIKYCRECDRYFDVRSGCEADIRFDEQEKALKRLTHYITERATDGRENLK